MTQTSTISSKDKPKRPGLLSKTKAKVKNLSLKSKENLPDYEALYEGHAKKVPDESVIGDGDFNDIGFLELSILKECGLQADHTLLDLGCGAARLARHAVPYLSDGRYIGVEIAPSILERAKETCEKHRIDTERVTWLCEKDETFPTLSDNSVDSACAFSVFTHMDAEDTYRYIHRIKQILKPGGRLIASFLLLEESDEARKIFQGSASKPYLERRKDVLCVCTSKSFVNTVAEMSGFAVETWFDHDSQAFEFNSKGEFGALGQAICVMYKTA